MFNYTVAYEDSQRQVSEKKTVLHTAKLSIYFSTFPAFPDRNPPHLTQSVAPLPRCLAHRTLMFSRRESATYSPLGLRREIHLSQDNVVEV